MDNRLILGAEWVVPVTSPPLYRHAIEIVDGAIQTIRPLRENEPFLEQHCLMPGLVNAHTHLAYTALRNVFDHLEFFPWIRALTEAKYKRLTDADIEASAKLGIYECLKAGITTVADMCDLESALKALSESPMRGVYYQEIFGIEQAQADEFWNRLLDTFPRFSETYGRPGLQIGVSPHACFTVRPELYSKVGEWAEKNNVPVSFHLSESREEEEFISRRRGPIQNFLSARASDWEILGNSATKHLEKTGIFRTKPLLAHLVQVSSEDLDLLQQYNISIAHCPKSNSRFGHGVAPVLDFVKRNMTVGLGTDSAASNHRLDLFEEGRFALLQQRDGSFHITEQMILEMITIQGARALGLQGEIGSLEEGKKADLIAVRIPGFYKQQKQVVSYLIHSASSSDVSQVWIGGMEISPEQPPESTIQDIYEKL